MVPQSLVNIAIVDAQVPFFVGITSLSSDGILERGKEEFEGEEKRGKRNEAGVRFYVIEGDIIGHSVEGQVV